MATRGTNRLKIEGQFYQIIKFLERKGGTASLTDLRAHLAARLNLTNRKTIYNRLQSLEMAEAITQNAFGKETFVSLRPKNIDKKELLARFIELPQQVLASLETKVTQLKGHRKAMAILGTLSVLFFHRLRLGVWTRLEPENADLKATGELLTSMLERVGEIVEEQSRTDASLLRYLDVSLYQSMLNSLFYAQKAMGSDTRNPSSNSS